MAEDANKVLLLQKWKILRQCLMTLMNGANCLVSLPAADHVSHCELLIEQIRDFFTKLNEIDGKLEALFTPEQAEQEFETVLEYQDHVTTRLCLLRKQSAHQPPMTRTASSSRDSPIRTHVIRTDT